MAKVHDRSSCGPRILAGRKSRAFTSASRASMTAATIRNGIESSQRNGHAINASRAKGHPQRRARSPRPSKRIAGESSWFSWFVTKDNLASRLWRPGGAFFMNRFGVVSFEREKIKKGWGHGADKGSRGGAERSNVRARAAGARVGRSQTSVRGQRAPNGDRSKKRENARFSAAKCTSARSHPLMPLEPRSDANAMGWIYFRFSRGPLFQSLMHADGRRPMGPR